MTVRNDGGDLRLMGSGDTYFTISGSSGINTYGTASWQTAFTLVNNVGNTWSHLVGGNGNGSTGVGVNNYGWYTGVGGAGFRMICDINGHTIFGNPSSGTAGPARLGVCGGNVAATYLNPSVWPSDSNAVIIYNTTTPTNTTSGLMMAFGNSNGYVTSLAPGISWQNLYLSSAGMFCYYFGSFAATLTAAGWAPASDEREKEDIQDLKTSTSLRRVLAVKPKHYRRKYYQKEDGTPVPDEVKNKRCIGFIAQDIQSSNPHCLVDWVNEDVKTDDDDGSRFGLAYQDYIVHLCGAVQEQQKMINVLIEHCREQEQKVKEQSEYIDSLTQLLAEQDKKFTERFNKLAMLIQQVQVQPPTVSRQPTMYRQPSTKST